MPNSLEFFDDWGDKVVKCKYAWWHIDELLPDTIIAYAKPCYDSIHYAGHARILAEAYLRKGNPDSALLYIQPIANHRFFKTDYSFYNSRRLSLLGKHEEANKNWEDAYYQQKEEYLFMLNQRLGAINAEYNSLNDELENKKNRLLMMTVYNALLLVVITCLIIALVTVLRYKKSIGVLEKDVVKSKERFNTLFELYKDGYDLDKETIYADVKENLHVMQKDYPKLTNIDLAIVWLVFMNCDRDTICKLLSISSRYYYNRRSIIQKELDIKLDNSDLSQKRIEQLMKRYLGGVNKIKKKK